MVSVSFTGAIFYIALSVLLGYRSVSYDTIAISICVFYCNSSKI